MKYRVAHGIKGSQLSIENITPAKTAHIFGYGAGVTFSANQLQWQQNSTFYTIKLSGFCSPTVVTP